MIQKEYDYDGAISTCLMDETGRLLPTALEMTIDSNPSKSESFISDIALKTANYYLKVNKPGYALQTADFIIIDERIHFYKSNGFVNECIDLLQKARRRKELYHLLKGHSKLEEGVNIAKKLNDTDRHIRFVLMVVRSKLLQNASHPIYSLEEQQKDTERLQLLLKVTHDRHLKEQLLYYTTLLAGINDWYDTYVNLSDDYLKIKAFDLYVGTLKNHLPHLSTIFKNLRQLLQLHNSDLDESMVKFFDVLKNDENYCMCSLMLQDLHVPDTEIYKKYKKDCDGMFMLNKLQIQLLFSNHTRSFAMKWLKIIANVLGYKCEKYTKCAGFTKVQDIIEVMHYYTHMIECKYYFDNFTIICPEFMNSNISVTLTELLSLPWICYIPVTDESVEALVKNQAVNSAFAKLGIKNSARHVSNWVFQHNHKIFSFVKDAEEIISTHLSIEISQLRMVDLSPVVSELEIITIGLLGIFSGVNNQQNIIIPQSYEISTRFFDTVNNKDLFSLLDDSKIEHTDILNLFYMIIRILLGDTHFESMLSKSLLMQYPPGCPFQQYHFERYFVLALTLLGNLTHHVAYEVKMLFKQNLRYLITSKKVKLKSQQEELIPLVNEAANACTTKEIFMIIYKIQRLHFRKTVTFDFNNKCFKAILPKNFPSFPLYSKVKSIQAQRELVFVKHEEMLKNVTTYDDAESNPVKFTKEIFSKDEEQTKQTTVPKELKLLPQFKAMTTMPPNSDPVKATKELLSEGEQTTPTTVPKELKLLPQFMWTKDQEALYGHIHIDKNVAKISQSKPKSK